ncbi:MAG: 6-pyruvoyl-tetrahydropterin synthase-related protein [Anaerolineae bacterium]
MIPKLERSTFQSSNNVALKANFWRRIDLGWVPVVLMTLFVVTPLWQPGLPGTADAPIHYYRTVEFVASYAPGLIYPRWAPHLAYGYGIPFWIFVPPLPYILPLPFWAAGFSLEISWKIVVALIALAYALGAYLFVRDWLGVAAGVLAAAVCLFAPFALRELLLYGGNYPQYLAIGLFPWLLWSVGRLARFGGWKYVLLTAAVLGSLVLSHLFHALIMAPVAVGYALLIWWLGAPASRLESALVSRFPDISISQHSIRTWRRFAVIGMGFVAGLAWSAFFWLPALIEREWTHAVEEHYLDVSPISLRFLDAHELLALPQALDKACANPWVPFALGPVVLFLVVAGVGRLIHRRPRSPEGVLGWFFLAVAALGVFMTLPQSLWLWLHVPFLAVAEFPWRMLGLINICLAFLAAMTLAPFATSPGSSQVHTTRGTFDLLAGAAVLAVLLGSMVYLYSFRPFAHYGERLADLAAFELHTRTIGLTTLGEYVPRWVEHMPTSSSLAEALKRGLLPQSLEKLDRAQLPKGVVVRRLEHSAVHESYYFESPQPFRARFLTFYFPGWEAQLDGHPLPISIEPGSGLIVLNVPAGKHTLLLTFGDTPLRFGASLISMFSAVVLLLVSMWYLGLWVRRSARGTKVGIPIQPRAHKVVWGLSGALLMVFLLKIWVIDPHTTWFRHHSPPGQVSGVQHPMRVDLDGRFWLLGYDLERDQVAQGSAVRVVLYWQALQDISINYRSFVHLDAPYDQRTWAISDNFHPGDVTAQIELPTGTWDTQHYVRDEHVLFVPRAVPPVAFHLRAGLYDPASGVRVPLRDGGDTILLQPLQITRGDGLRLDDLPNRCDYRLDVGIYLRGYAWDAPGRTLTLYWQADQAPEGEVVVFVHLLDEHGERVWGADSPPLGGLYPMQRWQKNEIVADPRPLALPALATGRYTIAVGLYWRESAQRLPVYDAVGESVPGAIIPLMILTVP